MRTNLECCCSFVCLFVVATTYSGAINTIMLTPQYQNLTTVGITGGQRESLKGMQTQGHYLTSTNSFKTLPMRQATFGNNQLLSKLPICKTDVCSMFISSFSKVRLCFKPTIQILILKVRSMPSDVCRGSFLKRDFYCPLRCIAIKGELSLNE